jgi:N-acetylglutamate synthase-like GNAT family acetyltransferase
MGVAIRKMTESDLPAAMQLLRRWNMAPRTGDASAERSGIVIDHSFVAESEGKLVGIASYLLHSSELAETASLAVDPDYRGLGLGYRLQQARLDEMRARGIKRLRTEADRPETIAWYIQKFGYRVVGTNPKKHSFSLPDVDHWTVLELAIQAEQDNP